MSGTCKQHVRHISKRQNMSGRGWGTPVDLHTCQNTSECIEGGQGMSGRSWSMWRDAWDASGAAAVH